MFLERAGALSAAKSEWCKHSEKRWELWRRVYIVKLPFSLPFSVNATFTLYFNNPAPPYPFL